MEQHEKWRLEATIMGGIAERVEDQLWNRGQCCPYGYEAEDPTLTGRPADGDDGYGIVLVDKQGQRFHVEVDIHATMLPPLEEDPEYIMAKEAKRDETPVDPAQTTLDT